MGCLGGQSFEEEEGIKLTETWILLSFREEIVYIIKCKCNEKKVMRAAKMLQTLPIYLFSDEHCCKQCF